MDSATPNHTQFINQVCAHEEQISPAVLDELGISYRPIYERPRWFLIGADFTDGLLKGLIERTRIKRHYSGECSDGPVGGLSGAAAGEDDFVPGDLDSQRVRETVLEAVPTNASGIRGGGGNPLEEKGLRVLNPNRAQQAVKNLAIEIGWGDHHLKSMHTPARYCHGALESLKGTLFGGRLTDFPSTGEVNDRTNFEGSDDFCERVAW